MTKRVAVYIPDKLLPEIEQLAATYGVSAAQVLLLGYKLTDRRSLVSVLSLIEKG